MSKKFNYAIPVILMVFLAACKNASSPTSPWVVSTIAGTGDKAFLDHETDPKMAKFYYPSDVTMDSSGNIYVADDSNHRIRKITSAGEVSTIAGSGPTGLNMGGYADGIGTAARFSNPINVAVDSEGNIYVADYLNNRIRKIEYRAP